MKELEYVQLICEESVSGIFGRMGIKIMVAGSKLPDLNNREITNKAYAALDEISNEIKAAILSTNEEFLSNVQGQRKELLALFKDKIFVEEIPNGYRDDYSTRLLPWFKITTSVGHFVIGWRKNVINIDWSETVGTDTVDNLFPDEDVTKQGKMIHAWGIEKAQEYIDTILAKVDTKLLIK